MEQENVKETRNLPVKLKDDERATKSLEFARAYKELKEAENSLKSVTKSMEDEITSRSASVDRLSHVVDTGIEHREVECIERQDRERLIVEVIRCDTQEVVQTRAMTANERQLVMFPTSKLRIVGDKSPEAIAEKTGTDDREITEGEGQFITATDQNPPPTIEEQKAMAEKAKETPEEPTPIAEVEISHE